MAPSPTGWSTGSRPGVSAWRLRRPTRLALGNITGAMVFQSMLPVAVGMAFTSWDLSGGALIACVAGLAGGLLALITLRRSKRFPIPQLTAWITLYIGAIIAIVVTV